MSSVMRASISLALLLAVTGCRAPRPSSIERWKACVVERGHIDHTGPQVEILPGATPVLYLHARWGDSPFVSEYSWGELAVELPGGLVGGATTTLSSGTPPALYREGGQIEVFESDRLEGTVRVVRVDGRKAVLEVALTAEWPKVDRAKQGSIPARGTITAAVVSTARDCW